MQKVSISGISQNGRSIDQERFQSTLPDLLFVKFDRSEHAKSFSFGILRNRRSIDQERFQSTLQML